MLIRKWISLAALLLISTMAQAQPSQQAELWLFVLQQGQPVANVTVSLNGDVIGQTNAAGTLHQWVAPGRYALKLQQDGQTLLQKPSLALAKDGNVRLLLSIAADGEQQLAIQRAKQPQSQQAQAVAALPPGLLEGQVVSAEDGSPLAAVQIFVAGSDKRALSDSRGHYALELPPGDYTLSIVAPGFAVRTLEGVAISSQKATHLKLELTPAGVRMADYVVTAPYVAGSVASVLASEKQAKAVVDIIGADQMSRTGASTAVDALRQVSGLTIEDGEYVIVRGQPERYTTALFNGSPLPSPDPIQPVVPLDLFPTGVLGSIEVQKSYTANRPGNFAGGLVALHTRKAPADGFVKLGISGSINPLYTGVDGLMYNSAPQGLLDINAAPAGLPSGIDGVKDLSALSQAERIALAKTLPNQFAVSPWTLPPNMGFKIAAGNRFALFGGELGVLASLDHGRDAAFRNVTKRTYALGLDGQLIQQSEISQQTTSQGMDSSVFLAVDGEWGNTTLGSNTFYVRKTTDKVQYTEGVISVSDARYENDFVLAHFERELKAQQLLGEHRFDSVRLKWSAMLAKASRQVPDRRHYAYRQTANGDFVLISQAAVLRRFSQTEDNINNLTLDVTFPFTATDWLSGELAVGVARFSRERDAVTRRFRYDVDPSADLSQPVEDLLRPDNLGNTVSFSELTQATDHYTGQVDIDAAYLQADLKLGEQWRLIVGARKEQASAKASTFVLAAGGKQEVAGEYQETSLLPAFTLSWMPWDSVKLSAAASKTVARPTLNEISPATYLDPDTGFHYQGNPELEPASIQSLDFSAEWFLSDSEKLSVGAFSKTYDKPLEVSFIPSTGGTPQRQIVNAKSASVSGIEAGARLDVNRFLGWIGLNQSWLAPLYVSGNLSLMQSEVTTDQQGAATQANRRLQGQADIVYNLQLGYDGEHHDAALLYNFVGERLAAVGTAGKPGVYRQPTPRLSFNYDWQITDHASINLSAENLLNYRVEYTIGNKLLRDYAEGRTFGAGFEWKF